MCTKSYYQKISIYLYLSIYLSISISISIYIYIYKHTHTHTHTHTYIYIQYCSKVTQAKFDEFRSLFTFQRPNKISRRVNWNFNELSFGVPNFRRLFKMFRIFKVNLWKRYLKNRFAVEEFHCTTIKATFVMDSLVNWSPHCSVPVKHDPKSR